MSAVVSPPLLRFLATRGLTATADDVTVTMDGMDVYVDYIVAYYILYRISHIDDPSTTNERQIQCDAWSNRIQHE